MPEPKVENSPLGSIVRKKHIVAATPNFELGEYLENTSELQTTLPPTPEK
jgi:hypothetical protein